MVRALIIILIHIFLALLLSWGVFRRFRINRPPIGVINIRDVAIMIGFIILIPILYMLFPAWVMISLLTLAGVSGLFLLCEVIFPNRLVTWLVVLTLAVTDLWILKVFGAASSPFFIVNNFVQVLIIASITNLWGQSGMKARDVAVMGLALMVYDFVFTSLLSFMGELFMQLQYVPFSPMIAWRTGVSTQWVAIGFGDIAMAAVFPLTMRKGFGKMAGVIALIASFCSIVLVAALSFTNLIGETFPVMVILGPIIAVQYIYWRRRSGEERKTWEYLLAEPLPNQGG